MMRVHYFRHAIKRADEELDRKYKEVHDAMKKDHEEFIESSQKLLAQMKAYNDKLKT